jgi:hypothetical protein
MTRKAGKSIVINSFSDGAWHKDEKVVSLPSGALPFAKNQRFELKVKVTPKTFQVWVDGKPLAEFAHTQHIDELREGQPLFLVVPVKEEHFGDPEELVVHAVWWGHTGPAPFPALST